MTAAAEAKFTGRDGRPSGGPAAGLGATAAAWRRQGDAERSRKEARKRWSPAIAEGVGGGRAEP
jgi:hypothetical protein